MIFYRQWPIRQKLILAFLAILLVIGTVSCAQLFLFGKYIESYNDMLSSTESANRLIGTLQDDFNSDIERIVNGRQDFADSAHHAVLSRLEGQLASIGFEATSSGTQTSFVALRNTLDSLHALLSKLEGQLQSEATVDERIATYESIVQTTSLIEDELQQLVLAKWEANGEEKEAIAGKFRQNVVMYWTVFGTAVALSLVLAWHISNGIAAPLRQLSHNASRVARGHLTVPLVQVTNRDEIGELSESFNTMFETLRDIIGRVRDTNELVAASSAQIDAGLSDNNKAGEEIAAAALLVTEALQEHDDYIRQSVRECDRLVNLLQRLASDSGGISQQAADSLRAAERGYNQLESFTEQFARLASSVEQVHLDSTELQRQFQEMTQMLKHIRGIAAETNILSLNASIEAQRALGQGKGFAVIAERVKRLAAQTASISQQTELKMDSVSRTVQLIQNRMQDSIRLLGAGEAAAAQAQKDYKQIRDSSIHMQSGIDAMAGDTAVGAEHLGRIHLLVNEIQLRAERIKRDMGDIAAMEEEQAASIHQVAASSGGLARNIGELNEVIALFHEQNPE